MHAVLLLLVLAAVPNTIQAQAPQWCSPTPIVQAALAKLPVQTTVEAGGEFRQRRLPRFRNCWPLFRGSVRRTELHQCDVRPVRPVSSEYALSSAGHAARKDSR
jgi:hypothetical protein